MAGSLSFMHMEFVWFVPRLMFILSFAENKNSHWLIAGVNICFKVLFAFLDKFYWFLNIFHNKTDFLVLFHNKTVSAENKHNIWPSAIKQKNFLLKTIFLFMLLELCVHACSVFIPDYTTCSWGRGEEGTYRGTHSWGAVWDKSGVHKRGDSLPVASGTKGLQLWKAKDMAQVRFHLSKLSRPEK